LSVGLRTIRTRPIKCSNIEQVIEYIFEHRSERPQEGIDMTLLDDRQLVDWSTAWATQARPSRRPAVRDGVRPPVSHRPGPARPRIAPLCYRGSGLAVSRAEHARRPVSTAATVGLAGLAALITLWLGLLAQASSDRRAAPVAVPDQLAVVQVQAGESLQHLAARVAPQVPVSQVVERIRDLNHLDSAAVEAGRTLIAPVG
jgi:hypothetical protein